MISVKIHTTKEIDWQVQIANQDAERYLLLKKAKLH